MSRCWMSASEKTVYDGTALRMRLASSSSAVRRRLGTRAAATTSTRATFADVRAAGSLHEETIVVDPQPDSASATASTIVLSRFMVSPDDVDGETRGGRYAGNPAGAALSRRRSPSGPA